MDVWQCGHVGRGPLRWGVASIVAAAAMTLTACGGSGSGTGSSSIPATPTPTPTPAPSPVPPAGGQFTSTGSITLVTAVTADLVTCSFPSLDGPEITMRVST